MKCLSPSSNVKCGTFCDFGRQTDFEKTHGLLLKALSCCGECFWRWWHYQQPFLLNCVGKLRPEILLGEFCLSSSLRWMFFAFANRSVSLTTALGLISLVSYSDHTVELQMWRGDFSCFFYANFTSKSSMNRGDYSAEFIVYSCSIMC